MKTGTYISGIGHGGIVLWVLLAGLFTARAPAPLEVADVTLLSGAEFAALSPAAAPRAAQEIEAPGPPAPADPARPPASGTPPATPSETPLVSPPAETSPPDPVPDMAALSPVPPTQVEDAVPEVVPPDPRAEPVPEPGEAAPRPAPRVAPDPAPPVPPEATPDPDRQSATAPVVQPEAQPETPDTTAPQEAASRIVTEAEETPQPGLAPPSSRRPKSRPVRVAAVSPAQTPPAPAAPDAAGAQEALADAVAAAVAEALTDPGGTGGAGLAASGPPLTRGEQDALRVAVSRCWNVGALSTEALRTKVVVAVRLDETGRPLAETIRKVSHSGGSEAVARQTYETARRAILRCGVDGFDLPPEKYSQWRDIEMTFNPENMGIR
ncbi:cell division and transport-associated protein TolA [Rhodovulum imhoffii]|uniref:Cell division and transport-associated protein TolA n=1 Tax=Rhodovulum imhoffii TaxID=365340 RepID=A0A2T5BSW3_9RHOB|nr:energy transducer TonB [Rhodovulum imhoffii]MBK5932706.1 hypothetical protein [Rhodovulum imhoffii]PTN02478.1 cell division and transport-associated protein TolA [Rhodovulum imhoffii]